MNAVANVKNQGWPCTKQYSLQQHRRTVRALLDSVAADRMTNRELSKVTEHAALFLLSLLTLPSYSLF